MIFFMFIPEEEKRREKKTEISSGKQRFFKIQQHNWRTGVNIPKHLFVHNVFTKNDGIKQMPNDWRTMMFSQLNTDQHAKIITYSSFQEQRAHDSGLATKVNDLRANQICRLAMYMYMYKNLLEKLLQVQKNSVHTNSLDELHGPGLH